MHIKTDNGVAGSAYSRLHHAKVVRKARCFHAELLGGALGRPPHRLAAGSSARSSSTHFEYEIATSIVSDWQIPNVCPAHHIFCKRHHIRARIAHLGTAPECTPPKLRTPCTLSSERRLWMCRTCALVYIWGQSPNVYYAATGTRGRKAADRRNLPPAPRPDRASARRWQPAPRWPARRLRGFRLRRRPRNRRRSHRSPGWPANG